MITNNLLMTTVLGIFAILTIASVSESNYAFAEESSGYKMAENTHAILTFEFRDGTETHEFPVYSMTTNYVSNEGTTFEVQGVVNHGPHLHQALDDAFKYRLMIQNGASVEFDYRFFDVDVEIVNDKESIKTIQYFDCQILDYAIDTLNDDYESYLSSSSGFAIVDDIEFACSGISLDSDYNNSTKDSKSYVHNPSSQTFAEDVRSVLTFEFDYGTEVIEFPLFELTSGFGEGNRAGPSFHVEGIANSYPFLDRATETARKVSGVPNGFNTDFQVKAEFVNGDDILRGLDFRDCHVSDYETVTYQDKEEGYTGKRGFAVVDSFDFTCAGMNPINPGMSEMKNGYYSNHKMSNNYLNNSYNMGQGPHVLATITSQNGIETIDFPIFEQTGDILSKNNPTFELVGVPGYYPILYSIVDASLKQGSESTGRSFGVNLFDVDVEMAFGDKVVRGYNYSDCNIIDYILKTQHDKEESYFKGFALTNEFHLECSGFHPNNPLYDSMFVVEKADTLASSDLIPTHTWSPGFTQ